MVVLVKSVYAATAIIEAVTVTYDNTASKSKYNNVQDAIDDLYNVSKNTENTSCLNVAVPNLGYSGGDKLIPVTISDDGTVKYADTNSTWYDYCNRVWANAVFLVEEPSQTYNVGDTIAEDDIQSYFVWIPKYKYKLWNVETTTTEILGYRTIDIVFDTEDTADIDGVSCKTPMTSGESGNCSNGEYMTHPAFISLGVDGFWVGKFETGYNGATSSSEAQADAANTKKIIIKPNAYSWKGISVYNAFMNSYNYIPDLNSHMMKNTEWGAVAYLSHSEYGINTEVNINNSNVTGYSSVIVQSDSPGKYGSSSSYTQAYNTTVGYKASTTGNISGIYDMSGGSNELMASYFANSVSKSGFISDNSDSTNNINKSIYQKYLDVYTIDDYTGRILGDATGELAPFINTIPENDSMYACSYWYDDTGYFIDDVESWFSRGGAYNIGIASGIFGFDVTRGNADSSSFRIVLSP
jgi:hypothetical protein